MRCLLFIALVSTSACDRVFGLDARPAPDGPPLAIDAPPDAHPTFGDLAPVALKCPSGRSPIDVTLDEQERRFVYGCVAVQSDIYEAEVDDPVTGGPATGVVISPPIEEVNSNSDETDPWLSADGRRLYFTRGDVVLFGRK